MVRFRSRPEAHLAPRYVDTGSFAADMACLANAEFVFNYDRLSLQGEYFHTWTDSAALSDPSFNGFYAFARPAPPPRGRGKGSLCPSSRGTARGTLAG